MAWPFYLPQKISLIKNLKGRKIFRPFIIGLFHTNYERGLIFIILLLLN